MKLVSSSLSQRASTVCGHFAIDYTQQTRMVGCQSIFRWPSKQLDTALQSCLWWKQCWHSISQSQELWFDHQWWCKDPGTEPHPYGAKIWVFANPLKNISLAEIRCFPSTKKDPLYKKFCFCEDLCFVLYTGSICLSKVNFHLIFFKEKLSISYKMLSLKEARKMMQSLVIFHLICAADEEYIYLLPVLQARGSWP